MNVFNKVTLESLKKNRTRTIVTIIGIMLSAAMICASTTLVSSMQNFVLRCAIHIDGDWYGAVYDAAYKDYEDIRDSDRVSSAAYAQVLGYAKIDSANERKPYLYVLGGDVASGYFETMPVHLILGALPKDSTEIILPEHLTSNGKVNYKLGDTVTLDVGDRTLDGRRLGQDTPVYTYDSETQVEIMSGERLENTEPRTYTVVGIYERPTFEDYSAPGYTALTAAATKSADQAPIHCYFKLHKPAGVYDFMKEMGYTQEYRYAYNTKVLLYSGTAPFDSFLTAFYSLAAIIIALIVFGSVSLIYNAFSISVSERTRQFGLLSSVGATRKQLRRMVLFEALAVSIVGIPLGILVGIGGIGITLLLIGDKFFSIVRVDIPMRLCVSWQAVVIAAVIALVTVLISAWIPSKRATGVSAVEAIRQSMDIKVSGRPVRTSKLAYKLFGLPGVLAGKHYKRNRKKYRTTVVSLFMSIVLADLLADHSRRIPFNSDGLSCMWAAAAPDRAGYLPCAAAVLLRGAVSMEVLQESGTAVLRAWHSAPGYCREADAVFPRSVSVRGQSLPCHGDHGGNWNGRAVCGALYTDAHAVRSQPAVL